MSENEQQFTLQDEQRSRRNFLAIGSRNVIAMGAIATAVMLERVKSAAANCGTNGNGRGVGCNCFLKGTKIRTAEGERKVEDLAVGDLLPTMFGGMRPIQWIGRHTYQRSDPRKPWVEGVRPVRVARSALAPNVPHSDLFLTQGHALFVGDVLVPVSDLINRTTITLYPVEECDELEYFHIKLETHDVIHAEGVPCETLLTVTETLNNFADYLRRYGIPKVEEASCLPRLSYNGGRGQIKSRVRSAISPWFDCREKIDVIRDRLEERGIALSRQMTLTS